LALVAATGALALGAGTAAAKTVGGHNHPGPLEDFFLLGYDQHDDGTLLGGQPEIGDYTNPSATKNGDEGYDHRAVPPRDADSDKGWAYDRNGNGKPDKEEKAAKKEAEKKAEHQKSKHDG
jgi:hypothetical protein